MATIRLIFALIGSTIPLVAMAGAIRSRDNDRFAEGLLIGMYLGALGYISLLAILMHFCVLSVMAGD
jgi:hypothetical protein